MNTQFNMFINKQFAKLLLRQANKGLSLITGYAASIEGDSLSITLFICGESYTEVVKLDVIKAYKVSQFWRFFDGLASNAVNEIIKPAEEQKEVVQPTVLIEGFTHAPIKLPSFTVEQWRVVHAEFIEANPSHSGLPIIDFIKLIQDIKFSVWLSSMVQAFNNGVYDKELEQYSSQ